MLLDDDDDDEDDDDDCKENKYPNCVRSPLKMTYSKV